MICYIIRRILYIIPAVFGIVLITFLLFNLLAGDITNEYTGPYADKAERDRVRSQLGLDKPLFFSIDSQFLNHLKNAVTFNFGRARDREKIIDKIKKGALNSLSLTVPILLGTVFLSVSLSLAFAFSHSRIVDFIFSIFCVLGMSIPFLSFILFGQYFLAYKCGLFPVYFWPDLSAVEYLMLPVMIGIITGLPANIRLYRAVMLNETRSDYVRTAFAKGLPVRLILFKHILKNAMAPVITRVVMSIPFLFLGSLLLERFFGIPGVGSLTAEAIAARDYQLLNAIVYLMAFLVVIFTLVADVCHFLFDPRISLEPNH